MIEKEIPELKDHEVLIKVQACGVCHGDALVKYGGYPGLIYPRTPGHEVVGTIEVGLPVASLPNKKKKIEIRIPFSRIYCDG